MISISIIVVTHNSELCIRQSLDALFRQNMQGVEVFVIDNASVDNTIELINEFRGDIFRIFKNHNIGYGAAVNQGIKYAKGQFILVLNDDVIIKDGFVTELKRITGALPAQVGMICPNILDREGRTIDSTGLLITRARRFYDRGRGQPDTSQFEGRNDIFGPCGAAAVYRKDMLEEIRIGDEFFDEDFFLILEDFDIAWRARKRGWEAMFAPELICYHGGGVSRSRTPLTQYYTFRNRYLLLLKNEMGRNLWKLLLVAAVYDIPRLIFLSFSNKHTFKAFSELFILAPKILRKRRNMQGVKHEIRLTKI
jgi:GT2 family glycosyltransferase